MLSAAQTAAPARAVRTAWQLALTALGLAATVAVAFAFRNQVAESFQVLSGSMLPTLEPGDRIATNKLAYHGGKGGRSGPGVPERGDVLVFRSDAVALGVERVPDVLTKRVIGLPGDRIEMRGGAPVINGWAVPTCDAGRYFYIRSDGLGNALNGHVFVEFLADSAYLTIYTGPMPSMEQPYVVGPNEVFVLGDNRGNSLDSRSWNKGHGGGVPLSAIEGHAQWFLVGTHRSGEADFSRLLHPLDVMQGRLRMEGLDAKSLDDGIARCMRERPKSTLPPPAGSDSRTGT
jgi:signal peptidase I